MKGKLTRLGTALLALGLLLGPLTGCGGSNPSVLQLPEGTAVPETTIQATPEPLTPLGDRTCYVGKETISESTLFSFILKEATFDPLMGLTLKLSSTNKSNQRDFIVSLSYLSVNGYMQDANYEASVPAGQSVQGEILIPADALRSAGVSTVDELILYPLIYDNNVPMGQGDVVDGAFTFYPTGQTKGTVIYPVRQKTATEQTIFDNGFATMIILSAQPDAYEDLIVTCYLENKTDRFLSFSWADVAVNGYLLTVDEDVIVAPGMRRYVSLPLSGAPANASEVTFKVAATPLSSTGDTLSPLMEQRGTYRFTAGAADPGTTGATGTPDPGSGSEPTVELMVTASPVPTPVVYTTPTSAQKKNAKNGYVNADKVNMRSGPGTAYKTVGGKVGVNTTVTLYTLQDGWWFLKCGNKYGYIKADYITQGKPKNPAKSTPAPTGTGESGTLEGSVKTRSIAALRKSADAESKCLKELSDGTKVKVYYKTKGKDGKTWYYVAVGSTNGYIRSDLVKVVGKVPSK